MSSQGFKRGIFFFFLGGGGEIAMGQKLYGVKLLLAYYRPRLVEMGVVQFPWSYHFFLLLRTGGLMVQSFNNKTVVFSTKNHNFLLLFTS